VVFAHHAYPRFSPVNEELLMLIKELGPGGGLVTINTDIPLLFLWPHINTTFTPGELRLRMDMTSWLDG
jgi:hypothetical protein